MTSGGFLFVVGIFLVVVGFRLRRKAGESRRWPHATATILESRVEESETRGHDGFIERHYFPAVRYEYEVAGRRYESDQMSLAVRLYTDRDSAERARRRYETGTPVDAFYNPQDPSEAMLVTGGRGIAITFVVAACFIALDLMPLAAMLSTEDGRRDLAALWAWAMAGFPESVPGP
jgi:hypothetical protein